MFSSFLLAEILLWGVGKFPSFGLFVSLSVLTPSTTTKALEFFTAAALSTCSTVTWHFVSKLLDLTYCCCC
ncbi:hypothetical protein PR003_g18682 [Phytophthora rubi]|uniref:Uncharacterized protein n=1 Tax=Phytophthora rubi TaxID=129364 RepID=A0A6A3L521_9STRA|nr:hypothetical protein PR001_g17605 [Phytophthora rubi]KAE9014712.1 hypothetical protein PR002_g14147 [Phytophthora rubi]KAE9316570.1 hypothetical protein PR003_g18682 [Phytophthora rubi]